MQIDQLMLQEGGTTYYDNTFRGVLEDHMTYLRTHPTTTVLTVDAGKAHKFEFDIFGLLADYGISAHLHWLIMRMNNLVDPTKFGLQFESLLIPNVNTVDQIRQSHMTTRRLA